MSRRPGNDGTPLIRLDLTPAQQARIAEESGLELERVSLSRLGAIASGMAAAAVRAGRRLPGMGHPIALTLTAEQRGALASLGLALTELVIDVDGYPIEYHEHWQPGDGSSLALTTGRTLTLSHGSAAGVFGTGAHAATRVALALMDRLLEPWMTVLDVGCGSGVLALCAADRTTKPVKAIDIDARAVESTQRNIEANGFDTRVSVSVDTAGTVTGVYDAVIANILPAVLLADAERLRGRVAPDGLLIVSGIWAARLDEVIARYQSLGMTELIQHRIGSWTGAALQNAETSGAR
jgi:precorrin-6B methylase 2